MKTLKRVTIEPVYITTIPDVFEENKFYISEEYFCCAHLCLCGCGSKTYTPIDYKGWKLTKHDNGKISLSPSISNIQFKCKSHYILNNNVANFV